MATRTLGFRLEFKGSAETEAALEKVRKKMTEIKEVIKKFESTPLTLKTSFDTKEIVEAEKQLVILKEEQKKLVAENKNFARSNKELSESIPKDSITALLFENRKLLQSLKDLSQEDRDGKIGQELRKQLNLNKEVINKSNEAIGNFQHNVGNYKSAITGSLPVLKQLQDRGILAQKDLANIFKGDLITREKELRAEISKLGDEFAELGDKIENAGQRAAVISKISDKAKELGNVREGINQTEQSFGKLGGKLLSVSDIITGGLIGGGIIALTSKLTNFVGASVSASASLESAATGFEVFGVEANKALQITEQLDSFAAKVPFSGEELTNTGVKLVKYGESIHTVTDSVRQIATVAAGSKFSIEALSDTFGRARETGTVFARDFLAIYKDIPGLTDAIAQATGKTEKEIVKLGKDGKLTFEDLSKGLDEASSANGKYGKSLDAFGKSIGGIQKSAKEFSEDLQESFGGGLNKQIKESIEILTNEETKKNLITFFRVIGEGLGFLVKVGGVLLSAVGKVVNDVTAGIKAIRNAFKTEAEILRSEIEAGAGGSVMADILAESIEKAKSAVKTGNKELTDEQLKAIEDANKAFQEQLKRIQELNDQILKAHIDTTVNEFDRRIEEARLQADITLDSLEARIKELSGKAKPTANDTEELKKLNTLRQQTLDELSRNEKQINTERKKENDKVIGELRQQQQDIKAVIDSISSLEIDSNISDINFNLDQSKRKIEIEFTTNLNDLKKQFNDGLITQEQFEDQSAKLEANKFDTIKGLYSDNKKEYFKLLDEKYQADLDLFTAQKNLEKERLVIGLDNFTAQKEQELREGKIKSEKDFNKLISQENARVGAEITKIDLEIANKKKELGQKNVEDQQKFSDTIVNNAQIAADKEIAIEEDKARRKKELLKEIGLIAIDIAQNIADTIFELENQNIEASSKQRKDAITSEYDNRIKLAKGNTAEIERLEREKDAKIKIIERQESERKKSAAIAQAIINAALAVIRTFAELGFIAGLPAAVAVAAITAIQIAKIKATKFAKGGYAPKGAGGYTGGSRALPDETGYRPVPNAVLHEGEHVSTERQVSKNRMLYEIIERDRIRTNNGQPSILNEEIIRFAEAKKQALYGQKPSQAIKYTPVIPFIVPLTSSKPSKVEFTDEHIDKIAKAISDKVETGSLKGSHSGSKSGMIEVVKQELRLERAALKSQV